MITPLLGLVVLGIVWAVLARRCRPAAVRAPRPVVRRRLGFDLVGEVLPALRDAEPAPRPDPLPTSELTTTRPARIPSFEADVLVPAAQSLITAAVVAIVVGAASVLWKWDEKVMLLAAAASLALSWAWRLGVVTGLLSVVEVLINRDLSGDGHIGEHPPVLVNPGDARKVAGELAQAEHADSRKADLLAFVHRCYVSGCSEADHGIKASSPERTRYAELRDVLFSLGLATWKGRGPRAGWKLTLPEREAAAIIAEHLL